MPTITEIGVLTATDDAGYYNGAFGNNATQHLAGTHGILSRGPWFALRFLVGDIDPDHITDVRLELYSNTNRPSFKGIVRVEQSAAAGWANNSTDRPDHRWDAVGSTGEVPWAVATTAGDRYQTPNLADRVKTALANIDPTTDYLGIIVGPDASNTDGDSWVQAGSRGSGISGRWPALFITHQPPAGGPVEVAAPHATLGAAGGVRSWAPVRVPAAELVAAASDVDVAEPAGMQLGWWDGTDLEPVTLGWWDGDAMGPVVIEEVDD